MRSAWEGRPIADKRTAAAPVSNPPLRPGGAAAPLLDPQHAGARDIKNLASYSCQAIIDNAIARSGEAPEYKESCRL